MLNEAKAFLYQPPKEPKKALVEGEKKSAEIIEFPQEKGDKNDENFEQKISQWSKEWIEDFYNKNSIEDLEPRVGMEFSRKLLKSGGAFENHDSAYIDRKKSEAIDIFMHELLNFIEKKIDKGENDSAEMEKFYGNIKSYFVEDYYECSTAYVIPHMTSEELFFVCARVNRLSGDGKKIPLWLVDSLKDELLVRLNNLDNHKLRSELIEKILKQNIPNLLDSIKFLELFLKENPPENWTDYYRVPTLLEKMFEEIEAEVKIPLVKYAYAENVSFEEILEAEEKNLITHNDLIRRIIPDKGIEFNEQLLQISSDAVGIFDCYGFLKDYAGINFDNITKKTEDSFTEIRNLIALIWDNIDKSEEQMVDIAARARRRKILPAEYVTAFIQFKNELLEYLSEELIHLRKELPLVHFNNLEKISSDEQVNPFAKESDEDEVLLFQQLHVPEMRKAIEKDLGIELTEIPLRSQFYLLQYISDKEGLRFGQLKDCLEKKPNIKGDIAYAFLICAENSEYADAILEIASSYEENTLKEIFAKYRELTEGTNQMEAMIRSCFSKEKEISKTEIQLTSRTILQKANEVLLDFSKRIKNGEVLDED
ncbi:MAG: hypothetical protein WCF93_01570, partial [Candidatus Moraniibacteriota bacterium]